MTQGSLRMFAQEHGDHATFIAASSVDPGYVVGCNTCATGLGPGDLLPLGVATQAVIAEGQRVARESLDRGDASEEWWQGAEAMAAWLIGALDGQPEAEPTHHRYHQKL